METEAKLNPFSKEVSLNVGADFQLIPSEDARERGCRQNLDPWATLWATLLASYADVLRLVTRSIYGADSDRKLTTDRMAIPPSDVPLSQ